MIKRNLAGILLLLILTAALLLFCRIKEKKEEAILLMESEAVLLFMEGDVRVKTLKVNEWVDAELDMPLLRGYVLKTGVDSWAEIGLGESLRNTLMIKENTLAEFNELNPVEVGLLAGEVRSLVEYLEKESTFEIKTPTAICGARGTGWDTRTSEDEVIVETYENEVYFYGLSKEDVIAKPALVKAGKRAVLKDPLKRITIETLPPEKMEDWNRWKDDFTERRRIKEGLMGSVLRAGEEKRPKVWVEELERGDYQLMINEEEE